MKSEIVMLYITKIFVKFIREIKDRREIFVLLIMAVLLIVYFVQNLFVFDMISTYMMWFLCLAFIVFLTKQDEREEKLKRKELRRKREEAQRSLKRAKQEAEAFRSKLR